MASKADVFSDLQTTINSKIENLDNEDAMDVLNSLSEWCSDKACEIEDEDEDDEDEEEDDE